jgi:hypothetical protein
MASNKRKLNRRDFTYYMQVTDDVTKQLIGYLSDISTGGFKLDCDKRLPTGQDFRLSVQLTAEIADKTSMVFIARSRWCRPDHIDPTSFNVGFEIINMAPSDMLIFQRMFEKYGTQNSTQKKGSADDYLWR